MCLGNTPTQQPFEGDAPDVDESGPGTSLREAVVGLVRSALDSARRRLSVFPTLDLGTAFVADESEVADDHRLRVHGGTDEGAADDTGSETEALVRYPDREVPLVQPARDTGRANAPDLEASEENGRLAIYYPEQSGARITSDTWEEVEP